MVSSPREKREGVLQSHIFPISEKVAPAGRRGDLLDTRGFWKGGAGCSRGGKKPVMHMFKAFLCNSR